MVSPEYHELAGKAKDVAAGAVLLIAMAAAAVAAIIFLPKIYVFCV
jgi:diacylglycerol kinase (ATP)